MIHPFAHMTSNHAFAQRGLDAFGRAYSSPAAFSSFQAAADQSLTLPPERSSGALENAAASKAGNPTRGAALAVGRDVAESGPVVSPSPLGAVDPEPSPHPEPPPELAAERPLPHIPRFAEVPAAQQWPDGPYRQAPAEYGGEWWQVSPFTGEQPWLQLDELSRTAEREEAAAPPPAFTRIFGEKPTRGSQVERIRWEQDLRYFKQAGIPEGFTREQIAPAARLFEAWGLGRPQFYEGRYGWSTRFPDSSVPDFGANPHTAIEAPHLVVARYQIRLAREGGEIDQRHPFVPAHAFADRTEA